MRRGGSAASRVCATTLLRVPLAQPRHAVPLFAPPGERLHMWRSSALAVHHQHQLRRLASLVAEGAEDDAKTLVACSVVAHRRSALAAPTHVMDAAFCATGVNHALHRQFNAGRTLKGILRGCAEQNALGVAAASGHRYASITDVYLYASPSPAPCPQHGNKDLFSRLGHGIGSPGDAKVLPRPPFVKGAVFPCPECWRNLSTVAEMRQDDGEAGALNLFVHAQNEALAVRSVSVARECLRMSPALAIDVTIVLPG
ncbi:uncharacterized protein Tco025E_04071 [Trypanosoma conorhini]|uniref:Uncharacterized protein n=1 Tax=Trypanosoma conorhini TaxID=83891 RepID=A0A3R7S2K2_9TRYP|nr:uncharacterized protein Tco025E_04071 [Trypanosoma conorhini]RNF19832.1 hypothetical protein Tco025E_04071 [Trypanosoma conorhini]